MVLVHSARDRLAGSVMSTRGALEANSELGEARRPKGEGRQVSKSVTYLSIVSGFYSSPFMTALELLDLSADLFSITLDLSKMNYKNTS